jgi:hypothetical protein
MNALVHEAIHSLLYMIEISEGFYVDGAVKTALQVVSPWSGRGLYLHSFVHACFVWFGLLCFWRLAADRQPQPLPRGVAEDQLARAAAGFRGPRLRACLNDIETLLQPALVQQLNSVVELASSI